MTVALSAKTLAEQKAGKEAIMLAVKDELLKRGDKTLASKFPAYVRSSHLVKEADGEWVVHVRMLIGAGRFMNFTDPFAGFPSDFLITQMMLVEQ